MKDLSVIVEMIGVPSNEAWGSEMTKVWSEWEREGERVREREKEKKRE